MYNHTNVPSKFKYPDEGLSVKGILSTVDINNPNGKNLEGEHICHVIKHGFTMGTTIGTSSGFMSHVRKDFVMGNLDSVEVAILPHDNHSIVFSRGGDSGALIGTDSSDITYAMLMEWVWDLIKDKFPGANLCFDDLEGFLADVV
ncbi:hypothetical protein EDB84DRAFT_1559617 [Lactarius hengduanensis]|nr:hypothetical protein EDB84DRAFT_1559617 [Lactarius hengduanensis]